MKPVLISKVITLFVVIGLTAVLLSASLAAPARVARAGQSPAVWQWAAYGHTATLLPNGKVIVAGGYNNSVSGWYLDSAECTTRPRGHGARPARWFAGRTVTRRRSCPTARYSSPEDGIIQTAANQAFAQLYDPSTDTWAQTGSMSQGRSWHTMTLLPNGKVLVAGGNTGSSSYTATADLRPKYGTWSATGSLATARAIPPEPCCCLTAESSLSGASHPVGRLLPALEIYDPALNSLDCHKQHGLHPTTANIDFAPE